MKVTFKYLTLFVLLALLLVPTTSAHAQGTGTDGGRVIFGSNFTVESGDEFNGDLVVFGGNVTIEENADLNGNLVVFGGTIAADGNMNGDVVIIGGQVQLDEHAVVSGDVVTIGGQVQREEGAIVHGEVIHNVTPNVRLPHGRVPPVLDVPNVPIPTQINVGFNPFWEFGGSLVRRCSSPSSGILATLFFQERLDRVSHAIVTQPLMTTSIGLLTIVVMIIAAFTLILLPIVGLGLIPLAFAWLFGVISMGQEIGDRFARARVRIGRRSLRPGWERSCWYSSCGFHPVVEPPAPFMACITWILPALMGLLAIGAVVITRFGTRPVQTPGLTVYTPPTDSGEIPPAS
jgi:hypothetical protein